MTDKVKFIIPGPDGTSEVIEVPELSWAVLEDVILPMMDQGINVPWYKLRANDARIAVEVMKTVRPELTYESVRPRLNNHDVMALSASVREMLVLCGFL